MKRCAGLLVFLLFSLKAFAIDPRLNWKTLETNHFLVHFAEDNVDIAHQAANIAEEVHLKLSAKFDWQPDEKTAIVISDEVDTANGYAIPFPLSRTVLFVTPPDEANSLEDVHNWLETLIVHEYVHVLHLDKASGAALKLRDIFGRHVLLFPNLYQPAWLIEGIATWYETDEDHGIGRGQSALFEMMMREEVTAGVMPVSQANLPVRSWPIGTTRYLYGVNFYLFLEQRYGEQLIEQLVENYSDNVIPFMINTNAEKVLNKNINELWLEFEDWLYKKYQPQIETLQTQGLIEGQRLTQDAYFTRHVKSLENGEVYYIQDGAFRRPSLMRIDTTGQHHQLVNVHSQARFDIHAQAGVAITQPEICERYNIYYDIYLLKPGAEKLNRLTTCGRYRSVTWSPDGTQLIAVNVDKSIHELQLLHVSGKKLSTLWRGGQGDVIGEPDWSPDGRYLVASVFRNHTGWNIERFELSTKRWQMITQDWNVDADPQYLADGQSILFSSEQQGQYNIYRYDFHDHSRHQLTRVASGAFKPFQLQQHSPLYYAGYGANGYDIYRLDAVAELGSVTEKEPIESESPEQQPNQTQQFPITDYSPWNGLQPRWWTPVFSVSEDQAEIGFSTSANDALAVHNYFLTLAQDTKNDWLVGQFNYAYSNRLFMGFDRSTSVLLDQNGNFGIARVEDDAYVSVAFPYNTIDALWNYYLGVFTSRSSDGRRAPGILPLPDARDNLLGAAMVYNSAKAFIRSISLNDGRGLRLVAESSDVLDSDYSGEVYTLDWREYLPLGGQHVLALRFIEGWGTDRPDPFELGGEDDDWNLLSLFQPVNDPLFGRREYPLRGYAEGLAALQGRRMQLVSMEYRFPLGLIERGLMAPPIGLMQWSGSLFVDSGATWNEGNSPDNYFTGAGLELHADVNLFYGLNMRLRLGYASGLDKVLGDERLYLSLGASF